jgi:transcriptional regulator GlxA family with amidase domain
VSDASEHPVSMKDFVPGAGPQEHLAAPPLPLNEQRPAAPGQRFAFLLIPGFSYIAFASAIEPLRMANMVAAEPLFGALTCSLDGGIVSASNGVRTEPDCALDDLPAIDAVFVCGPNPIVFPAERHLIRWLRRQARGGTGVGGIDTGSVLLARAGLLDGYRCTIHWQDLPSLTADFPGIIVSEHVYEIDRGRYTCSGGTAAMDMMLRLVAERTGDTGIRAGAADLLVHERIRDARDRQRIPLRHLLGPDQDRLSGAVALMEANVEEPMTLTEIAACIGVTQRQLERLFEARLGSTPTAFYMGIRLARARHLLRHTGASVGEVAQRCGFRSPAHFSRRYRREFGVSPRADRVVAPDAT